MIFGNSTESACIKRNSQETQTVFPTGACCVRPLLRKSPTAAAEWAKPREIRRGTPVEAPEGANGCRTAVLDNFNTPSAILLSEKRARPVPPDLLHPELPDIENPRRKLHIPVQHMKFPEASKLNAVVTPHLARPGFRCKYKAYFADRPITHIFTTKCAIFAKSNIFNIRKPKYITEPDWNSIFCSFWPARGLEISDSMRRKSTFPTPAKSRVSTSDWSNPKWPEIEK